MFQQVVQEVIFNGYSLIPYSDELRAQLYSGSIFFTDGKWVKLSCKEHTDRSQRWHRESKLQNQCLNKLKVLAHRKVTRAIARRELVPEPCINCDSYPGQAHHWDYTKPLDIIWYCNRCHSQLHTNLGKLKARNPFRLKEW